MLRTILPLMVSQILLFSVPNVGETLQYAYFFVVYTILNVVFYTINNIAYMTLSVRITPLKNERVQLGVWRFMFATIAGVVISSGTMVIVDSFGGGTVGWRIASIIYSVLFAVVSLICVCVCRELPNSELVVDDLESKAEEQTLSIGHTLEYLVKNKYFLEQLAITILYYILLAITTAVGVYYMTYILKNPALLGAFSLVQMLGLVIGLVITPILEKRWGIYKANVAGFGIATLSSIPFLILGFKGEIVPMMIFSTRL